VTHIGYAVRLSLAPSHTALARTSSFCSWFALDDAAPACMRLAPVRWLAAPPLALGRRLPSVMPPSFAMPRAAMSARTPVTHALSAPPTHAFRIPPCAC
jgi:hypothetical protein